MVRHEDIGASGIELVEPDGSHFYAGQPNAIPGAEHEHAVEKADIAGDEGPGKADQGRDGQGQGPESEHCESAYHRSIGVSKFRYTRCCSVVASPFSHAARCVRCSAVICSISFSWYEISSRPPTFHFNSRSAPHRERTLAVIVSPGARFAAISEDSKPGAFPSTSRMLSPVCRPARSASVPGVIADTIIGPSKLREAVNPKSATVALVSMTRNPTKRKKSFHGISSVAATYFEKKSVKFEWVSVSADSRTPSLSGNGRPFWAKLRFIH